MIILKRFLLCTLIVATLWQAACGKNVLLLLADDAGFEMGAYMNKYCQTPHLDALANRGLIFNNAFTTVSSCSPSRAQILTGQVSHSSGMYGLHNAPHNFNVSPGRKSLPNYLRENLGDGILSGIIGKKHVGPAENFVFDYEQTEEEHSVNQVARNITNIKIYMREFLKKAKDEHKNFFLVIAFHDPHRCGHITPQFGEFCELWGSGQPGMGTIPDWQPIYYDWRNLEVPDYLPQTDVVRQELAAQYMTISRLDQGVGVAMRELQSFGFDKETLIIYTSDNGPPFPLGRTNMYEHGIRSPLLIISPNTTQRHHETTAAMASLLDLHATVIDYLMPELPANRSTGQGRSLLPLLDAEPQPEENEAIFGSQNYHEITMNYPMRMIRTRRYKLIHNLNYQSNFPIDQDFYASPTFQQILNATLNKQNLPWYKSLRDYYKRPEWELYDIKIDPLEQNNLYDKPKLRGIQKMLMERLSKWQQETDDPWRCAPHGVLEDKGYFKDMPACLTLGHEALPKSLTNYEKYILT